MRENDLHNEDAGSAPQQKKVWVDPVCVPVEIVLETWGGLPAPTTATLETRSGVSLVHGW
jgi:hypothetical protein